MAKQSLTSIDDYVTDLMHRAGFDTMPEQFREDYRQQLTGEVERRIGIVAMSHLEKKDLDELAKILDTRSKKTPERMLTFFQERIDDFPQKMADGLREFTDEFLASVQKNQRGAA